jgi:NitT/TauT family transport system permease protein
MIWVLVLATWEGAYRIIGWKAYLFPAPSQITDALLDLLNVHVAFEEPLHRGWPMPRTPKPVTFSKVVRSPLIEAICVSCIRLSAGFAISILLGAVLGMLMWRFGPLDDFLGSLFLGMQTLPSVCWVPLGIILFKLSESAVEFVLVMGSFFAIAIALRDGLRTIPPLYQRAGLMLGAGGWKLYLYVLLPASLPALASGLRQGFSFAWRSLMGAEFVFAVEYHGLGFLLQNGREDVDPATVIGIMIVMVIIGMLADRLIFAKLERRVSQRFGLVTVR